MIIKPRTTYELVMNTSERLLQRNPISKASEHAVCYYYANVLDVTGIQAELRMKLYKIFSFKNRSLSFLIQ